VAEALSEAERRRHRQIRCEDSSHGPNAIKPVRCPSTPANLPSMPGTGVQPLDASAMPRSYIRVRPRRGWRALPQHYGRPAYSGGNLDRPALQQLLKDIDGGRIDVIVVYKIDR